jgi:ribosomal-protein-alanine N-acetyltransferase
LTHNPSDLNWREGLPLLVSPRVVLRELRRSDAAALWRVARRPEVARFCWPAPSTVEAFESLIAQAWRDRAEGKYTGFAVVPRDRTEAAGLFELRSLQPAFFRAELGLLVEPDAWQSHVFEEGMRLVCDFAFRTLGVQRIEVRSSVEHAACNTALERLGLVREAVLQAAFVHDGRFEDQALWALVNGLDRLAVTA